MYFIIVLLILAGISISMLSGDNGILQQTTNAKTKTVHANVLEQMQLEANAYTIDKTTENTSVSLIDFLKGKSIITPIDGEDGKWQINVEKLLGSKQSMGNGTATKDKKEYVYLLEEQPTSTGRIKNVKVATITPIKIVTATSNSKIYNVVYYRINVTSAIELGNISDDNSSLNKEEKMISFSIKYPNGTVKDFNCIDGTTWKEWANSESTDDTDPTVNMIKNSTDSITQTTGNGWNLYKLELNNIVELVNNVIKDGKEYTITVKQNGIY